MAANKFATMLNRNTNKITLVLVYAVLEWVLILLLLLNSLLSYLIIRFADYFGLKRPCILCSRLDHLFEPKNIQSSYRSLVCEAHAFEISQLGYCSNHKKLAEFEAMCGNCLSNSKGNELGSNKIVFFPWMKKLGLPRVSERSDEFCCKCSCCGTILEENKLFFEDDHLGDDFLESFDDTKEATLVFACGVSDKVGKEEDAHEISQRSMCDNLEENKKGEENRVPDTGRRREEPEGEDPCVDSGSIEMAGGDCNGVDRCVEEEKEAGEEGSLDVKVDDLAASLDAAMHVGGDRCCESQLQHLEFFIDQVDCHLIPVESVEDGDAKEQQVFGGDVKDGVEDFLLEFDKDVGTYELVVEEEDDYEEEMPLLLHHEIEKQPRAEERILEDSLASDSGNVGTEQVAMSQATQKQTTDEDDAHASFLQACKRTEAASNQAASEELLETLCEETEVDVSIGTEIPEHEAVDDIEIREFPSISSDNDNFSAYNDPAVSGEAEENPVDFRTVAIETSELVVNTHLPPISESNEIEEDPVPDTPTSMDGFRHVHKKLLMLERKESGTESLDGSFISDLDSGDAVLTVEKLKSVLRVERKTLHALYSELEEERNASAVAANQTMAMINRLQEEKAAMQMEALQYQRMMDEQSEYDQEALQLLNELMIKREREKEELEKELELYRKKVHDYEARERLMISQRRKKGAASSGTPTGSYTNSEDGDRQSNDFDDERKEENGFDDHQEGSNQNTPVDAVLYLEESLANFEEERISILEHLKALEAKLFLLSDGDEECFEDIKSIEHLYEGNGNGYHEECDHNGEANGNGRYKEMNGNHPRERKNINAKAKTLLPLFDAIDLEAEKGMIRNGQLEIEDGPADVVLSVGAMKSETKFDSDDKKLAIEEEVDHLYERLQALEADREFLKHCVSSMRKGDKGVDLLQEILQHLRDLRSVELRVRSIEDSPPDLQ